MNALQSTFLGYAFRLAQPEYLLGIVAAGILFLLVVAAESRGRGLLLKYFSAQLLSIVAPAASRGRRIVKGSSTALAIVLFSIALARPQCGTHTELAKRYGIDLVVAIDASSSMLAKDIKPSRLERAKLELSGLIDRLKGDRVGIVVFAGDAFTQCPLTTDYSAAKMFLRAIDPSSMPAQGTNIPRALEESRELLVAAERGAKARAIVLLTDGEDTVSDSDESAKQIGELKSLGIRVVAVGIGSITGEPIPELDNTGSFVSWKKDSQGNTVMSRLDEAGLSSLVSKVGGRFIHSATGSIEIDEIAQELEQLDKAEFDSRLTVKYAERFQYLLLPGLALLLIGSCIRSGKPGGKRV